MFLPATGPLATANHYDRVVCVLWVRRNFSNRLPITDRCRGRGSSRKLRSAEHAPEPEPHPTGSGREDMERAVKERKLRMTES